MKENEHLSWGKYTLKTLLVHFKLPLYFRTGILTHFLTYPSGRGIPHHPLTPAPINTSEKHMSLFSLQNVVNILTVMMRSLVYVVCFSFKIKIFEAI